MSRNKVNIGLHFVWATWDRQPFITSAVERALYRCIESVFRDSGCDVLAVNGMEDHIHALVMIPATLSVAELVRRVKSTSSKFANDQLGFGGGFRWQGSYGVFSVSASHRKRVIEYIRDQKNHHIMGTTRNEAEQCFVEEAVVPAFVIESPAQAADRRIALLSEGRKPLAPPLRDRQ